MPKVRNIAFIRTSLADSSVIVLWICGVYVMSAETAAEKKALRLMCKEINAAFKAGSRAPELYTTTNAVLSPPGKGAAVPWFRLRME